MDSHTTLYALLLFCLVAAYGRRVDDDGFSSRPSPLEMNSMAARLDKYLLAAMRPQRNSFHESEEDLEEDSEEDDIGMRGNFKLDGRRSSPQQIMRESDEGAPVPASNWQNMIAPFVPFIPKIGDYCGCAGIANCGCCLGFHVRPLFMKNNACANVSLSEHQQSGSKHMLRVKLHLDRYKIIDISVSEKRPPTVCVSILPFSTLSACAHLGDVQLDKAEHKVCTCAVVSLQAQESAMFSTPNLCLCLGRPYEEKDKQGPFRLAANAARAVMKTLFENKK